MKAELTIKDAVSLYENLRGMADIHDVRKQFKLPHNDYCVRLAHCIWCKIMQIHSYQTGVGHLNNTKFLALANYELENLNKILAAIHATPLDEIHKQLSILDKIADNVH